MNIGIVCYPTHGGSGVVASELAIGLAHNGHAVHIVSYAPPFRLRTYHPNIFIHEVEAAAYPLFKSPSYELSLAAKLVDLAERRGLEIVHAHYAVPHAVSAYLAKQIFEARRAEDGHDPPRHGHHPGRGRPVLSPGRQVRDRTVGRRDGGFDLPEEQDDRGIRHPARDPGHPQFHRSRPPGAEPRPVLPRHVRPERGGDPDARLQFPPGQEGRGRHSHLRPSPRADSGQARARRRRARPADGPADGVRDEARRRRPFPRRAGPASNPFSCAPICFSCRASRRASG